MNRTTFSQAKYSELAVTGRGNLNLVGTTHKLQKEVFEAFNEMKKEAFKDGISIQIVSAYRSFNRQNEIWDRKYTTYISEGYLPPQAIEKIIEYSTIPGTSRHHWGTDIDIIDSIQKAPNKLLNEENYSIGGSYLNLKIWMDNNAERFGFYLVYDDNPLRNGFKFEPWHYSFMAISKPMLNGFLEIDLYKLILNVNLKGNAFLTKEFLDSYLINNILDINPKLK
ncbi:MAG: D-alanyl-D-alanine carboxypeptidase [Lutibacter sp.]|nr:MAG: D-alanyl-D-alanine carboxypeptidase [Lutibacter sp.]